MCPYLGPGTRGKFFGMFIWGSLKSLKSCTKPGFHPTIKWEGCPKSNQDSIRQPWSINSLGSLLIPPFTGNPCNGYTNHYYKVDDHPLVYGINGSLDPSTYDHIKSDILCVYFHGDGRAGILLPRWLFDTFETFELCNCTESSLIKMVGLEFDNFKFIQNLTSKMKLIKHQITKSISPMLY